MYIISSSKLAPLPRIHLTNAMKTATSFLLAALVTGGLSQEETTPTLSVYSYTTTTPTTSTSPVGSDMSCTMSALAILSELPTLPNGAASYALTAVTESPSQDPCSLTWPASLSSEVLDYESSVSSFVSDRSSQLSALAANCTDLIDGPLGSAICTTEAIHVFTEDGSTTTEAVGYTVFPELATETGTSGTATETATTTETDTATETGGNGAQETGEDDGDSPASKTGANVYAVGALVGVLGVAAAL
ncbi:hypothetical protein ACHAQH_004166 [Verticillium albo-atrum]